ncbi:MAG: ribosome maturation factor RimM [Acidobacteria bacterium]|nr:ribosome maturation factor RimM [Acidobacteriota bacterium]
MEHGSWQEMAIVGVVARTHGRRGEVVVNPETDFPEERFRAGGTLFMARAGVPVAVKIRDAWFHGGRPVVSFERVDTLSAAESLRGAELRVPDEALQPLPPDTWYEHELVGCVVRTVSGDEVGTVAAVEGPAGAKRLIVGPRGREIDVPLVAEICVTVDADAESIVIDPPHGLLEVNRTRAAGGGRRSGRPGTGSDG